MQIDYQAIGSGGGIANFIVSWLIARKQYDDNKTEVLKDSWPRLRVAAT